MARFSRRGRSRRRFSSRRRGFFGRSKFRRGSRKRFINRYTVSRGGIRL